MNTEVVLDFGSQHKRKEKWSMPGGLSGEMGESAPWSATEPFLGLGEVGCLTKSCMS